MSNISIFKHPTLLLSKFAYLMYLRPCDGGVDGCEHLGS